MKIKNFNILNNVSGISICDPDVWLS